MRIYIYIVFVLLLTTACEITLNVPLPEHEEKLVVNAMLQTGETFDIYLTRSYGPLENVRPADILIDNAVVELINGANVSETLTYKDTVIGGGLPDEISGKYFSLNSVIEGETYTVKVSHPDYPDVMGTTTIPLAIEITDAGLEQNVTREIDQDGTGRYQSILNVDIIDEAGIDNFYEIFMILSYIDPNQPNFPFTEFVEIEGIAQLGANNAYTAETPVISDETFDGQATTLELLCHLPNAFDDPTAIQDYQVTQIVLFTISANGDYAEYFRKLDIQAGNANDIQLFPSEAAVVPNNVENGYGVIGGYTTSFDTIPQ